MHPRHDPSQVGGSRGTGRRTKKMAAVRLCFRPANTTPSHLVARHHSHSAELAVTFILSSTLPKKQARHVGISRSHMAEEAQTSLYQPFGGQRPQRDSLLLPELHSSCFVPKCQRTLHYICRCTDGRTRTPTHLGFFRASHVQPFSCEPYFPCCRLCQLPAIVRPFVFPKRHSRGFYSGWFTPFACRLSVPSSVFPLCQVDFQDRSLA